MYTFGDYSQFFFIRKRGKYGRSSQDEVFWREPDWHATKKEAAPISLGTSRSGKLYVTCHRPENRRYHSVYIISFISTYENILLPRKYRKAAKLSYTLSYHLGCDIMADEPYWREAYEG